MCSILFLGCARVHDLFDLFSASETLERCVMEGQLECTVSPEGRVVVLRAAVRIGRLFGGICKALVCFAAVYKVLRR